MKKILEVFDDRVMLCDGCVYLFLPQFWCLAADCGDEQGLGLYSTLIKKTERDMRRWCRKLMTCVVSLSFHSFPYHFGAGVNNAFLSRLHSVILVFRSRIGRLKKLVETNRCRVVGYWIFGCLVSMVWGWSGMKESDTGLAVPSEWDSCF